MSNFKLALVAILVALAVHSRAFATDAKSLPGPDAGGRDIARKCLADLQAFDQELERAGFGVLAPEPPAGSVAGGYYVYRSTGTPRQRIRVFRNAAYAYAVDNDERSCQTLLRSARDAYEHHQSLVGTEADDPDIRAAWRRAHLARAQPVGEMTRMMRADIIIGADLRNPEDQKLGEIMDVVIDPRTSRIAYVLVYRGGFLGLGRELVAVRWRDLRATGDHEIYVLDASKEAFNEAPRVDRRNFEQTNDQEWRESLDRYWAQSARR